MSNIQIGHKRRFSFVKELCEIVEIIENPNISMVWDWNGRHYNCSKCGHEDIMHNYKTHFFKRIELLIPISKQSLPDYQKCPYLVILGFDSEGRTMFIPKKEHSKIFSKSKKFRGIKIE